MELDYKQIGRRIAKRRKKLNLKQAEVSERADISNTYMSKIHPLHRGNHALGVRPGDHAGRIPGRYIPPSRRTLAGRIGTAAQAG